jgi:uroporphyrinogen decarboxylase
MELTSRERIRRIFHRESVDRIGLYEHFWGNTISAYQKAGHMQQGESPEVHFGLDIIEVGAINLVTDIDYKPQVVEETETTITIRDGNGAILRRHKLHETTPEHIGYAITCADDWAKIRHRFTEIDERRINFEGYRKRKAFAREHEKFLLLSSVNVFEAIHPICGHENMLFGMADNPDWIYDMADVLSNLIVRLQTILFEREGLPDGFWYSEDMGYKGTPFMSPQMYRDLIMPGHKKTFDFAHSLDLPVVVHSCGFVEPFVPYMIEAGMDCLQAMEVKAGMDLLRIYEKYGDKIVLMGGMDVRCMLGNNQKAIDKELEEKIPIVMQGNGYILHSDHSIPSTVHYETLRYFMKKGLELGRY